MIPINLVLFQMSDFRYEIKRNFITLLSDLKLLTLKKSGSVRLNEQRTTDPGSWLVDPVDDEDWRDRPRTDPSSISDSELA
jgi:hypothetical protein